MILLDCREGEPDRSGAKAVLEGFFDPETGEPRRSGQGVPRLRVLGAPRAGAGAPAARSAGDATSGDLEQVERFWGFECWWRPDPRGLGFTATDREDLEAAKRLLRGLIREARSRFAPAR